MADNLALIPQLAMYPPNPFTLQLDYRDVPKAELRQFFHRFKESLNSRTIILTAAVRADDAYATWSADRTPDSLGTLSDWFVANVQTRPKTAAEMHAARQVSLAPSAVSPVMLTDKTYSLAADVGMYFACVFMTTFLHLQWTLPLGSKNFVDYGQPVLAGFRGEMMLNPVRVATMVAWGAARKTAKPSQLRNTYEVWASYIDGSP